MPILRQKRATRIRRKAATAIVFVGGEGAFAVAADCDIGREFAAQIARAFFAFGAIRRDIAGENDRQRRGFVRERASQSEERVAVAVNAAVNGDAPAQNGRRAVKRHPF